MQSNSIGGDPISFNVSTPPKRLRGVDSGLSKEFLQIGIVVPWE